MCPPCVRGNCYPNRANTSPDTRLMDNRAKKCSCHLPDAHEAALARTPPNARPRQKKNTRAPLLTTVYAHSIQVTFWPVCCFLVISPVVRYLRDSYLFLRPTFTFHCPTTEGDGHLASPRLQSPFLCYFATSSLLTGSRRFAVVCIPPLCMDDALVFLAGSLSLHDWLILPSVSQTFSRILADELDRDIWESVEDNNWVLGR